MAKAPIAKKTTTVAAPEEPIVLPLGKARFGSLNGREYRVQFDPNTPIGQKPWLWAVRNMREGGTFADGRAFSRNTAVLCAQEQTTMSTHRDKAVEALYPK